MTRLLHAVPRGVLALIVLGCGAAFIYSFALVGFPLLALYHLPHQSLVVVTKGALPAGIAVGGSVFLLMAGYALGMWAVQAVGRHYLLPLVIAGFPLIFTGLLVLVHPVTSTDLYDYLFRARMLARYEANTFTHTPQEFAHDPLFAYISWPAAVTAYGPLWEGASWLVARITGERPGSVVPSADALLRLLLGFKLLATLGYLLCGAAIWGALKQLLPGQRELGLYLWMWNPLVLWETVAAGHNDSWMVLMIVLSVWALGSGYHSLSQTRSGVFRAHNVWRLGNTPAPHMFQLATPALASFAHAVVGRVPSFPQTRSGQSGSRERAMMSATRYQVAVVLALVALTIGGLVKYLPLMLGPVVLVAALRPLPNWRERLRLTFVSGFICSVLLALAYLPFWEGWGVWRNVGDRRSVFAFSWLTGLRTLLEQRGVSSDLAATFAAMLGLTLLVVGLVWTMWRAWRAPRALPMHLIWLLLWFIAVCNPAPQPWYGLWIIALVALHPTRRRCALVVFGSTVAFCAYLAIGFVVPRL